MKRRQQVEYEDASPEVKAIYDETMDTLGTPEVLNVFKALGSNAPVLRGVWSLLKGTLVEGEIPLLLKQLILFKISVVAGNEFCKSVHGHDALNLDSTLTFDDLTALANGTCAKLPVSFQVAIDVVSKAALTPKNIADENFDFEEQLLDEGFSESEIDELLAQGMLAVYLNMLTDTFEVPIQQPFPGESAAEA
jgi:alkylhydroperoxidase family enzyme